MSRPDELVTLLRLRFNGRFDELIELNGLDQDHHAHDKSTSANADSLGKIPIELPDKFKALYTKQRKTKSD